MRSLERYIAARGSRRPGWVADYERDVSARLGGPEEVNYAYLSGHYHALLEDALLLLEQATGYCGAAAARARADEWAAIAAVAEQAEARAQAEKGEQ